MGRTAHLVACLTLAAGAASAAPPVAEPESVGMSSERLARLDRHMRALVERGERAGIVTVIARHGRIVHLGEYGARDVENGRPMRVDTLVRLYAMTQPITTVAVLMLYEEGRFQLHDPIGDYLPELKELEVLEKQRDGRYRRVPARRPVTIRHLLTHTSGIGYDYPPEAGFRREEVLRQGLTLAQMIPQLAKVPLLHHPGEGWTWGLSTDVLARLVEVVSEQPFDRFLEERLFRPLNMLDTGFRVPPAMRDRFAEVYTPGAQGGLVLATRIAPQSGPYDTDGRLLSGSLGLVSTAIDYWSFAQMLVNGGELEGARILAPSTVELMLRNHVPTAWWPPRFAGIGGTDLFTGHGFGLGLALLARPEEHGVAGTPGLARWGGNAGTAFWIDPEKQLVAVLMSQHLPKEPSRIERDFQALVYQAITD